MPRLHALELLPDAAGQEAVRRSWLALRHAGLPSQLDHPGDTNAPHVTVLSAPALDPVVTDLAVRLLGPLLPLTVRASGLLVLGSTRVSLARSVDLPDAVVAAVLELRAATPERQHLGWLPHVSLARRVPRGDLARALEVLEHDDLELTLVELRRWDPEANTVATLAPRCPVPSPRAQQPAAPESRAESGAGSRAVSLADRLLEAQVAFHLDRLSGDQLASTVARLADGVLTAAGEHQLGELVDPADIRLIVTRALATVPGSAAVGGIIEMATDLVYDGPEPGAGRGDRRNPRLGEVVDRVQVEVLLDRLLALHPVLARGLDQLADNPLVGTVASRFMGRIVGEVLQANQAVADRVPGLGSLMSFGTSAASRMMGAADKQFEGLLGDTMGRGGTFAVRRLNKIVIETLRDPTTREAVLSAWDLLAQTRLEGMHGRPSRDELGGVVDAAHELAISTLAGEHVATLAEAVVDGFFDRFGGYTPTELLDELDLDDLIADLVRIAPGVIDALRESGDLERLVRTELEPFYASAEVRALLDTDG